MTQVSAGTFIAKTTGATTKRCIVDGANVSIIGGVYMVVNVRNFASFDASDITFTQVPMGTRSITIP